MQAFMKIRGQCKISRRSIVGGGMFALAFGASRSDVAVAGLFDSEQARVYQWEDALKWSDVEAATVSPTGECVAVQVRRPLGDPGVFTGATWARPSIQPRAEIWLVDGALGNARRLSAGDLWVWAPEFSPSGARIAALASFGNGHVGFAIWDVASGEARFLRNINIEIYARFSSHGVAQARAQSVLQLPRQFVWLDNETIAFVDSGKNPPQLDQAIQSTVITDKAIQDEAAQGDVSVRVWSPKGKTCGSESKLAKMNCLTGEVIELHRGDIRGASVSPDGRWIAALTAKAYLHPLPDGAGEVPLRITDGGDDPLVSLSLVVIDLMKRVPARVVGAFRGVGNVAPSRLPIWANDSKRFAVASRQEYTSLSSSPSDAAYEVEVDPFRIRRWPSRSALDSELSAALIVSTPKQDVDRVLRERPRLSGEIGKPLPQGQIIGTAWKYGPTNIAVWDGANLVLLDGSGVTRLPASYGAVFAPVVTTAATYIFAIRIDGSAELISLQADSHKIEQIPAEKGWDYMGILPKSKSIVFKNDLDTGTFILSSGPNGPAIVSPLKFNEHLAPIQRSTSRELTLTRDGKTLKGVLQLPPGRSAHARHPVIIWAYPDQTPSVRGSLTRLNTSTAITLPLQYLLTQGFAIFHAPLSTERGAARPMKTVAAAVLPWLDLLNQQPDILAEEFGFFGHSNGGYVALALEAQTSRFKAIVANATFPDLGFSTLSSSRSMAALDCAGQLIQANRFYYEDPNQPYAAGGPPWERKEWFFENSPLFHMENASTPLLLMVGEFDAEPRQMEALYSVLYGRNVPVELRLYRGEGHVLSTPGNIHDMWLSTRDFFRAHLGGTRSV